ncbi:MAG: hypothetical protein R3F61_25615 [Myxococcota bacterium]
MGTLRATTVPVHRLTTAQRDAAWAVFSRYYENTDRERFERDLAAKDHVFLLHAEGRIVGFSTVCVDRVGDIVSIFSGDTVLEPAHHGAGALQWAFFRYIVRTKLRNPHRLVTWFLISKGYKTYLLLARNFPTHWPRRGAPTPDWARELLVTLATRRFGDALDPDALVLRFTADHERLRPDVAPVEQQEDPDIRFFATANPGHADGDELCCLGVVDAHLVMSWPMKRLERLTGRTAPPAPRP